MRTLAATAFLTAFLIAPALAQPAAPRPLGTAPVCLHPFDSPDDPIDHTHYGNARTLLFYMRDGKVWVNTLKTPCPGLAFHGFDFVTHQDEICSNAQAIRVIESGETCELGEFTPYTPPPSARFPGGR